MMKQLEIQYFWPLTDQTTLDLDFTPSEQWIAEWRNKQWNNSTVTTTGNLLTVGGTGVVTWTQPQTSSFVIRPSEKNVGKWEITSGMFVYRPTKPNAVVRFMAKLLLGFKWHDEI
jgi:hypothetical protein